MRGLCALLSRVQEASKGRPSSWGSHGDSSEEEEGDKERHKQFKEWRKKHYNEFYAVKRAKELMKQVKW